MKIPKRFKLFGKTINVSYQDNLHATEDCQGWAKHRTCEIVLQNNTPQTPFPDDSVQHNFCHELVHHILYAAGEDQFDPPIHKREYLVDRIAGLLHQALDTMEFEDEE